MKTNLRITKKTGEVDNNNKVGTILSGAAELIDLGLGEQMVEKSFWSKVDNGFDVGHVFEDVDLDNFTQKAGDKGIIFLYPKPIVE